MPYPFKQIFAADPSTPDVVATDSDVVIFAPGDPSRTPLEITDPTGVPLPNPIKTDEKGFASAFIAELPQVAWEGGGLTGTMESYEGLRDEAVAAADSARSAMQAADLSAASAAEAAAAAAAGAEGALAEALAAVEQSAQAAQDAAGLVNAPAGEVVRSTVLADLDDSGSDVVARLADRFAPELGGKPVGKGELVANIKDYGAKGDGSDDTAAIQAAINTNRRVYVPEGVYIVSDPGLMHVDGLNMFGDGKTRSILKKKASTGGTNQLEPILRERFVNSQATAAKNIVVENIGFEGNGDPAIKTAKAAGLLRFYEVYGLRVISCAFYKGRGYGAGFEGAQASPLADRRGPAMDVYFEDCDFYSNGKQAYLTGTDTDDGVDFKTSDRATLINCRAWDNGDKGFDIRARSLSMIGCHSWSNAGAGFSAQIEGVQPGTTSIPIASATFVACWAKDNTGSGFSMTPAVTPGVVNGLQFVTYSACHAVNNSHNFSLGSSGSNDLAVVRLSINGAVSLNPKAGTRHFLGSAPAESVTISGGTYMGGTTAGISPNAQQVGPLTVTGATIENTGGSAITGSTHASARSTITGNTFRNITGAAFSGASNTIVSGNSYENVSSTTPIIVTGTNNRVLDKHQGVRSIASASAMTLPEITDFFTVTGTTTINTIAPSWAQRQVVLRFTGVTTVSDGATLILASSLTTANNTMLTLVCDGTVWFELSRSNN